MFHFFNFNELIDFPGRAGRYGSKFPVGEVACLCADDLPLLHSSLTAPSSVLEVMALPFGILMKICFDFVL
ncbi:hypothetical protein SLEP1_g49869 [Rubroshorea leprosula]|uniref:Uncharacterized protein n=1 Tax=Rubroshorea leprosula TaxID=152421 RepID=A0AAV5M196_9ROSI|nr:hypothetical protein SLEP1_g49869 [Rubroshorea leprosula]